MTATKGLQVETGPPVRREGRILRFISRAIATGATLFWLFVLSASVFVEEAGGTSIEGWFLLGLIMAAAAGSVVMYLRQGTGSVVVLIAGVALAVFAVVTAGRNQLLAVLVSGFPFIVAGLLGLIADRGEASAGRHLA